MSLFDEAHARRDDPDTSHAAAASVTALTATRLAIIDVLATYGPATDETIALHYDGPPASPSGLRTRRSELVRAGSAARGHVVNLGHGVLQHTPVESVAAFVRAVQDSGG